MPLDSDFLGDRQGLLRAIDLLGREAYDGTTLHLPARLPEDVIGCQAALEALAPGILCCAARLGAPLALSHMDPPTPWLTWAMALWNASLNQNLLHPATAPVARDIEAQVIAWLAPFFGMSGGHMTAGSTLANLTALWAARECAGIEEIVAADCAHLSVAKAAHILGLRYRALPSDHSGALVAKSLPDDLTRAALVLTAGTTATGAIDSLELAGRAGWTHVDAAWAGPLRLSAHADRLSGIERADSVAVSAHKWLFQPKESALVLFRDTARAHAGISFGGAYLAAANVGVLGSHGATAVPLLATLLAWGRSGVAARIEQCMRVAERLAAFVDSDARLVLRGAPRTGIVVWRPRDTSTFGWLAERLPRGAASTTMIAGEPWFRMVAANPNADVELLIDALRAAVARA